MLTTHYKLIPNRFYRAFAISLLLVMPISLRSQSVEIEIHVLQSFSAQAKLYVYNGIQTELVDSSWQHEPGTYKFNLSADHTLGMYRVDVGKNITFDLVVSNEPYIDVKTVVFAPNDSLRSLNSVENQILWDYQGLKKRNEQHTWLIKSLMDYYSDSSMLKQLLESELYKQSLLLESFAKKLKINHPDLFVTNHILLEQKPIPPLGLTAEEKSNYQINSWWEEIKLNEPNIIHSPAFSNSVWGYIELLFDEDLDKEEQEQAFIKGISELLNKSMDVQVRDFTRSMLIEGFIDSDYTAVVEFLETSTFPGLFALKQKPYPKSSDSAKVNVGDKAFDFEVEYPSGKSTKLSKINAEYILIIFWSSWCPHCIETLPRLADLYNSYRDKGLEIIAISIDEEEEIWREYIKKLDVQWINVRTSYSSGSKIISKYEVEETPKMFLLDRTLTIISRPSTKRQLEAKLKKLTGK